LFGLRKNLLTECIEEKVLVDDYDMVHQKIQEARVKSLEFLEDELELLIQGD
jgi:hypothetical protein